jgi:hypothetical protein
VGVAECSEGFGGALGFWVVSFVAGHVGGVVPEQPGVEAGAGWFGLSEDDLFVGVWFSFVVGDTGVLDGEKRAVGFKDDAEGDVFGGSSRGWRLPSRDLRPGGSRDR